MATFPIISDGHQIFRRWFLIIFGAVSVLLLAILLKITAETRGFQIIGIFIFVYSIIYLLFRNYRNGLEITADQINILEYGRVARTFNRNNLAAVKFRLVHPSLFMAERIARYSTQHFIQLVESQEIYEYEVQESDMQSIVRELQSMSYHLVDLAEAMDYFQEDSFYKYALRVIFGLALTIGLLVYGVILYL